MSKLDDKIREVDTRPALKADEHALIISFLLPASIMEHQSPLKRRYIGLAASKYILDLIDVDEGQLHDQLIKEIDDLPEIELFWAGEKL